MSINVTIFDHNKNVCSFIIQQLRMDSEFNLVNCFSSLENCVEKISALNANVVLLEIGMPDSNAIEAIKLLKGIIPNLIVIVQTVFEDEENILASLEAGASGYILKTQLKEIGKFIKQAKAGGAPMSPCIARKLLKNIYNNRYLKREKSVKYNLTKKEEEVLRHIVNGLSYKMVSAEMNITYSTVRNHVKNIYQKFNVGSLTEMVARALQQQLV